jgi:DNA-binding beta-propeller fold protein YncE
MNQAMKILLVAGFAVTTSGAAMASHICAYVNDNVSGTPNTAEGYMIGPGTAIVYVGRYATNGSGTGLGFTAGGYGATRVREGDLYVDDTDSRNITHFTINKTNCTLTLDTTLYPSGETSGFDGDVLAITPNGRTMFVGSYDALQIYSHTISANGSLGATFTEASTPDAPQSLEVSPDGKTLVVSYDAPAQVCAYPISGGHLGTPNCQSTAGFPAGVSIDPVSACVYAAEANPFGPSEVAAFTLTGGVLGVSTEYNPFGPGRDSEGILVNWDNKAIYVTNSASAQMTIGAIGPGCKLTFKAIISDGGSDNFPGQIAQARIAHGPVVNGDCGTPTMGIFHAHANGNLTPIGTGQFQLHGSPQTVVVVGAESP